MDLDVLREWSWKQLGGLAPPPLATPLHRIKSELIRQQDLRHGNLIVIENFIIRTALSVQTLRYYKNKSCWSLHFIFSFIHEGAAGEALPVKSERDVFEIIDMEYRTPAERDLWRWIRNTIPIKEKRVAFNYEHKIRESLHHLYYEVAGTE